jgi:thiamine pyrophosphate-dependent acetolactate synthase large subunit-like protein
MAMVRAEALKEILAQFPTEPIIVTLGTTSREVMALSQGENHLHVLDSMGLPPAIGLGVALGLAGRYAGKVVVLEGDGGLLMGLSALATIGHLRPDNLVLLILDNGTYGATGGQETASSTVDFCQVARGCAIAAWDVENEDGLADGLARVRAERGPSLLRIRIDQTAQRLPFYLPDPPVLTERFRRYLESL